MKIAVVTDSGSGLTKEEANSLGLHYLPLQIVDGEQAYLDGVDITYEEVYQMIREEKVLKTSQPPLGLIYELFQKLKKEGYTHIISVMLTSGISGTMHNVEHIAKETGLNIVSIECFTTCSIQGYLAKSAQQLADQSMGVEAIVEILEDCVNHSNTLIIPNDLDHLKRGGRLTPLAAALGGMLKIKPILKLNKSSDGKIDTYAKVRTMTKAFKQGVDTFKMDGIEDDYLLIILHTDALESANELRGLYFESFPSNLSQEFGLINPVISVHTGIGCVGMQYIKKVKV